MGFPHPQNIVTHDMQGSSACGYLLPSHARTAVISSHITMARPVWRVNPFVCVQTDVARAH